MPVSRTLDRSKRFRQISFPGRANLERGANQARAASKEPQKRMYTRFYGESEIETWGRLAGYGAAGHSVVGFQADLLVSFSQVAKNHIGCEPSESSPQVIRREYWDLWRAINFFRIVISFLRWTRMRAFEFIFFCDRDRVDRCSSNTGILLVFVRFLVRDMERI